MKKDRRFTALHVAFAAASIGLNTPVSADPVDDLKAQVDSLSRKLSELEQKRTSEAIQPATAATSNIVTGGATKGSFKLPGSDTSVTLGGYVKLDAIYSDRAAGRGGSTGDQEYEAGAVPVGPDADANPRSQVKLHARQSRFNIKTGTPTGLGDLTTFVEFDLFGTSGNESVSNSNGLRVRHAYGSLGNFLAGQTWTTFSDVATYPETVDFGGPAGVIFARQAQVRWTQPFAGGQWALALENPETVVSLPTGQTFRADDDHVPDIAGNIKFDTSWGKYSIAALARQIRINSPSAPASREQKWGAALGVNGVIPLLSKDDVRLSAYYGNAIGRYAIGFFTDGILDADSHLALPKQWLAMAAYRHFWSANLRSTVALSGLGSSNPAGTAGSVNKAAESAHVNVIWSPIAQVNLGLEYIHATREIEDGQKGRLNRIQAAAQYTF
ncbi:MAG: DcaP family trimeric outer membrane transporter [Caldimonas sp.]